MTRDEAEARAAALNQDATARFFARERGGAWEVVRVALPPGLRVDPLKASVESRPKPDAPDPRTGINPHAAGF